MEKTEQEYKDELLRHISELELNEWLRRNPIPADWIDGKYSFAYTEMPVSKFLSWWRKNFLGYKI